MRMFISGYNRIPNHLNTLRVDAKIFVSAKKYLRKKNLRIRVDMALVIPSSSKFSLGIICEHNFSFLTISILMDHNVNYFSVIVSSNEVIIIINS